MQVGRFAATLFEIDASAAPSPSPAVQPVQAMDLPAWSELLATPESAGQRLELGDRCLGVRVGDEPAGLLWVNLQGHIDTWLGDWSKPTQSVAYYNQLYVSPDHRRQGLAAMLVNAAVATAHAKGRGHLRSAVLSGNTGSHDLHRNLGFEQAGRCRGVRIGALTIRLPIR